MKDAPTPLEPRDGDSAHWEPGEPEPRWRWWQGWDPAEVFRVAIFVIPGGIIAVLMVASIIDAILSRS